MYSYRVKVEDHGEIYNDIGVVGGSSYAVATIVLEEYFGEGNILSLRLLELPDSAEHLLSLSDVKELSELFQEE